MPVELASVETLHCTPRRTRLRIPSRLGSPVFFDELQRRLAACHGVNGVRTRHHTATVVIWHDPAFRLDSLNFAAFGLIAQEERNGRSIKPRPRSDWREKAVKIDTAIKTATNDQADLPSIVLHLATIAITRRPLTAVINWALQACLKAALKSALTPKLKRV